MRTQLLAAITTATSTLTQFAVSQELPFEQSGTALFLKNKKRIYVDEERREQTTLFPLLNATDIYQDDLITNVYLSVDAKNPPSQLDSVVSKILSAKANTGIVNFGVESDYSVDKQEDVLIYTFEFRINTIT
jgi:hypothetical protein